MAVKDVIELVEVSPRDGLQNEPTVLSTQDKVSLIGRAEAAGVRRIEAASFVNPARVPQMADAEAVIAALPGRADVVRIGLVLNLRGAERALATAVDELGAVCTATDAFGEANQGRPSQATVEESCAILALAQAHGRRAQATIAVAFGCPFEGAVDPERVVAIARTLAAAGALEVAIADTIGVARPGEVARLTGLVRAAIRPLPVRVHLHDTRGMGVANVMAAVEAGAATIDASIGGTGGCPFAPGAAGNVASEGVAYALGPDAAVDLDALLDAAFWLNARLGRTLLSPLMRAKARAEGADRQGSPLR